MADVIKKNDFVEIDFVGRITETNAIFDTTKAAVAKKAGIARENHVYRPVIACVGQENVVKGLDTFLEGKEIGKSYTVSVLADDAFGKKKANLLKLVPTKNFLEAKIRPTPGLDVTIDGQYGTVKTVTGGRTIVDFNHPLSGKDLSYEITLLKKVTDVKDKLESFLSFGLGVNRDAFHITITGNKANVKTHFALPKEFADLLNKKANELISELKEITYEEEKEHAHTEGHHTHT